MARPEPNRRYPELEQKFARSVCRRAGLFTNGQEALAAKICDEVQARMAKGAEEYGPTQFWRPPITQLVRELEEEANDMVGWGSLLNIRLLALGRQDIATNLEVATTGAIRYHNSLSAIERLLLAG